MKGGGQPCAALSVGSRAVGKRKTLAETDANEVAAKLQALKIELRRRMHHSIPEQGAYLRSVLVGHVRYYGVHDNAARIGTFRKAVVWLWRRVLERRSQCRVSWRRLKQYVERWLPPAQVCHPYPLVRFGVTT
jgi:hypothetical protein